MGFIQKLATRSNRVKENKKSIKKCDGSCEKELKIPKLTLRYILTLKNWK
tara:strand:- start:172 stop:321 length:150 start_codon:yes stop_codon:yes gene_type:complete